LFGALRAILLLPRDTSATGYLRPLNKFLHAFPTKGVATGGQGRRHGGTGGKGPPTPHKGHFYKSPRTDEKKIGGMGRGVTSPTIFEFQPEFVTSGFQRPDLTYILSNYFLLLMY